MDAKKKGYYQFIAVWIVLGSIATAAITFAFDLDFDNEGQRSLAFVLGFGATLFGLAMYTREI